MAKWQAKIAKRARFADSAFTPQEMFRIGTDVENTVRVRIRNVLDVHDMPAPPLKVPYRRAASGPFRGPDVVAAAKGYPYYKPIKWPGAKPVRDWWRTGHTLRAMKVLTATSSRVVIGFTTAQSRLRAYINNRRWEQFGLSPKDKQFALSRFVAVLAGKLNLKSKAA